MPRFRNIEVQSTETTDNAKISVKKQERYVVAETCSFDFFSYCAGEWIFRRHLSKRSFEITKMNATDI
jgi:hypothetical protein